MKPKILIHVSGGNVQSVCSNTDTDIVIIDYDNIRGGQTNPIEILSQDFIADEQYFSETIAEANQLIESNNLEP